MAMNETDADEVDAGEVDADVINTNEVDAGELDTALEDLEWVLKCLERNSDELCEKCSSIEPGQELGPVLKICAKAHSAQKPKEQEMPEDARE